MIESFGKDRRRHAVQKFSYGRARGWHPDRLVLECECGRFLFYPDPSRSASLETTTPHLSKS
jgi:hypothetical protein